MPFKVGIDRQRGIVPAAFLHRDPITNRPDAELVEAVTRGQTRGLGDYVLLGLALLNAYGMNSNEIEGARVLTETAGRGNASAQTTLGYLYCLGHVVEHDLERGLGYLQAAKIQGSEEAAKARKCLKTKRQPQ